VKGHHFPNLTLVGVVDGDMSFSSSDLRANENTFQLLTQVSGRAGREAKKGEVVIQTYNPDNSVMQAIKNNDREAFVKQELLDRENALMPPFAKLGALILSSRNKEVLEKFCYLLKQKMPIGIDGIQVYGPIDSPLSYLKNNYRKRFLIVVDKKIKIQDIIKKWLSMVIMPSSIKLKVDVDPYNFM
jgi:primosomal protein N' (replication factor Y)